MHAILYSKLLKHLRKRKTTHLRGVDTCPAKSETTESSTERLREQWFSLVWDKGSMPLLPATRNKSIFIVIVEELKSCDTNWICSMINHNYF